MLEVVTDWFESGISSAAVIATNHQLLRGKLPVNYLINWWEKLIGFSDILPIWDNCLNYCGLFPVWLKHCQKGENSNWIHWWHLFFAAMWFTLLNFIEYFIHFYSEPKCIGKILQWKLADWFNCRDLWISRKPAPIRSDLGGGSFWSIKRDALLFNKKLFHNPAYKQTQINTKHITI